MFAALAGAVVGNLLASVMDALLYGGAFVYPKGVSLVFYFNLHTQQNRISFCLRSQAVRKVSGNRPDHEETPDSIGF